QREVLVQLFVRGLVRTDRDRSVRRMLEAQRQTGVAFQREAERVVRTERETVLEAPVQRHLNRMIGVPEPRLLFVDVAVAAEGAQQVRRVRARARYAARAERRVLVPRLIRGAEVDRVQIDRAVRAALELAQPVEA